MAGIRHPANEARLKIINVLLAPAQGAFYYDDQAAIRSGARLDGFTYVGDSVTPGFDSIRMPARALGIGLQLDDGAVVWGDMMSVQYAGAADRDRVFYPADAERVVRETLIPRLVGIAVSEFHQTCAAVLAPGSTGARLPIAVEYGISQALLRAAAHANRRTMAEVLMSELGLSGPLGRVPIFSQSGDARETNVDKMILKRADVLPHGLFNSPVKLGRHGAVFLEFLAWTVKRIRRLAPEDYRPTLHFDVYGCIGLEYDLSVVQIAAFIARAAELAAPFRLNIESPADFGSQARQIEGNWALLRELERRGCTARLVADEWCNTLDDVQRFCSAGAAHMIQIKTPDLGSLSDATQAVLVCKRAGMEAYVGGSCAETDLSAQACVHVAVATQADMLLAKPGMGVDEGLTIVGNEQNRLLAEIEHRARLSA